MPRYEVCIIETREHIFEIEAANEHEAQSIAEELDPGESIRDAHREQVIDYIEKLEGHD